MKRALGLVALVVIVLLAGCGGGSWKFTPKPVVGDDPAIRITKVAWGGITWSDADYVRVAGKVYNVDPRDYVVSIWIHVEGAGWWPKPTFAHPLIGIGGDGGWGAGVDTGGRDKHLDAANVYLVKKNTWKPTSGGWWSPPAVDPSLGIIAMDNVVKPTTQTAVDTNGVVHEWEATAERR